jgi:hypothetical protein
LIGSLISYFISALPNFDTNGNPEIIPFIIMEGLVILVFATLLLKASKK